jgi:hypothetical protein
MQQRAEQIVDLMDTQQRHIGQMQIERQEDDLLVGTFVPGPAFPSVKQLFRDFEEAVDVQALPVIDELDAAIAALGLYLRWPDLAEPIASKTCKFGATAALRVGSAVNPPRQRMPSSSLDPLIRPRELSSAEQSVAAAAADSRRAAELCPLYRATGCKR